MRRRLAASLFILVMGVAVCVRAGTPQKPLSADDLTLLLIGGSNSQKIISLIEQRGIDFKLTPALAKQFYQDGATDDVMDALEHASQHVKTAAPSPPANQPAAPPPAQPTPTIRANQAGAASAGGGGVGAPAATANSAPRAPAPAAHAATPTKPSPPPPSDTPLPDPSPAEIQHIIQAFAAKETLFKEARNNYTYHQTNRVETLDANNQVNGSWEQDWDILFDGSGNRIQKVTYAPPGDLKGILITRQDIKAFETIQPFVLTTDQLPDYNIRYLGHVRVDYLTCYVFEVQPNDIKRNRQYFKGIVYVDDRDLQIVLAKGRNVPQTKDNKFPRFATYRQQIDGKYWFPVFTRADDTLYFDNGPAVPIIEIIHYTDYHYYGARTKIISYNPVGQASTPSTTKH
jgi:hypothetical protein